MNNNRLKRYPDRKTILLIILYVVLIVFLSGVYVKWREEKQSVSSPEHVETVDIQPSEGAGKVTSAKEGYKRYVGRGVSFEVEEEFTAYEGYDGAFVSPDGKSFYQLQGVSKLGSHDAQSFYEELVRYYRQINDVEYAEEKLRERVTAAGDPYKIARIEMRDQTTNYTVDVIISESKDLVVTLCAQCGIGREFGGDLDRVSDSLLFEVY